ncbi:MAG: RNB domain-containing ribonuclease, partial [Planctomycetota bacterium]
RRAIQELLAGIKGHDFAFAVNLAVLRSFEKAEYAPLHIGHYALASTHYCHFTSPIRRYADLTVHRLLESYLRRSGGSDALEGSDEDLTEIGKHITFTEQRADSAEKELTTVLLLQMLSKRIGDELDCVTTGLTGFGVFVQCKKFGIEGLIKTEDLGPDSWRFDKRTQSILGLQSGVSIRLGQSLKARIVSVNVPGRQLSLMPSEPLIKTVRRKPKAGKREKAKKGEAKSRGKKGKRQRTVKRQGRRR